MALVTAANPEDDRSSRLVQIFTFGVSPDQSPREVPTGMVFAVKCIDQNRPVESRGRDCFRAPKPFDIR